MPKPKKKRILIMGAAGRDFHNFNVYFRENGAYQVVCFTAAQIPTIEGRRYPKELSGSNYLTGIPIYPEAQLTQLIKDEQIDEVVFAYSDVSHETVMEKGCQAMAAGANFWLLGPRETSVKAKVPVIAICAVRTGSGKSQTSRKVTTLLKEMGKKVVAIRHPMPYGDLTQQICQRFASHHDLKKYHCTIEEREEYEPYLERGQIVYAGIDYQKIVEAAQTEAEIIVWDGGNNDCSLVEADLLITVVDPLRAGHERRYYPGEVNFLDADVIVINKYFQASHDQIQTVMENIQQLNPDAKVIKGRSKIEVEEAKVIAGKKVLVIEDGPTLTHGEMSYGAGCVAAQEYGAAELVDPRPYAKGSIAKAYVQYPQMKNLIPALGYYPEQLKELEQTINSVPCDLVLVASPIDLREVINIKPKALRVRYELEEQGEMTLKRILADFLKNS